MATTINSNTTDGIIITPDTSGEIHLQANGVTKAKVTANGLQDANGASLRGGSFRNLIINGDMQIAQRGTSVSGLGNGDSGYHTVDRWLFTEGGASTAEFTQSQDTDVPTGQGFAKSLKMACTTADTSLAVDDAMYINHKFEGQNLQHLKYGTSSAEKITISFWVKSNKTGTYTLSFYNNDNARANGKTYTINTADTWEKKTITFDGDTVDGFDNDNLYSFNIYFVLFAGTDWTSGTFTNGTWEDYVKANFFSSSQVNLADSTSNYINITGVQLEVGEGASDFEFLPYDVQLARCERYYQKNRTSGGYSSPSGNDVAFYIPLYPQMRATPNVGIISLSNKIGDYYSSDRTGTSLGSNFSNISNISYNQIVIVTTTANKWHALHNNAIYFDAEL